MVKLMTVEELYCFVENNDVAIYGAGIYGITLLNYLSEVGLLGKVKCIVVSEDKILLNPPRIAEITVTIPRDVSRFPKVKFIIALSGENAKRICQDFHEDGIYDYSIITKELHVQLNYQNKNVFADVYKYNRRLGNKPSVPAKNGEDQNAAYIEQLFSDTYEKEFVKLSKNHVKLENNDPKLIAYYLPQFYTFPENDEWWGRGFTEWSNVTKAVPQFVGHYQPQLPIDLGFYDLENPKTMRRQAELAKQYGIYGFCFYYYWFSGKYLLRKPLEMFLEDKTIDMPFCLFWANHSWTRTWANDHRAILAEQKYLEEDPEKFILDLLPFFEDSRYIRKNGAPMLIIYIYEEIPDLEKTVRTWRETAVGAGIPHLHLVGVKLRDMDESKLSPLFEEFVEFIPNSSIVENISDQFNLIHSDCCNNIYSYESLTHSYKDYVSNRVMRGIMTSWDNTPRCETRSTIFQGSTPKLYEEWLTNVIQASQELCGDEDNYIFINAWNEWGEGAHLEPDMKYGYAYLQATARAIERSRRRK